MCKEGLSTVTFCMRPAPGQRWSSWMQSLHSSAHVPAYRLSCSDSFPVSNCVCQRSVLSSVIHLLIIMIIEFCDCVL